VNCLLWKIWALALAISLTAAPAFAAVTLTFYAHSGNRIHGGYLLFPHAYVRASGHLDDTGDPVDWAAGFTARDPGPQLLFVRGPGVVSYPDPAYVDQGKGYLSVTVSDAAYRAIRARAAWWASPEGSVYDLRRRNCITFIADLARLAGLRTGTEPSMSPGRFMTELVVLNPPAAVEAALSDPTAAAGSTPAMAAPPDPVSAAGGNREGQE